MSKHHTSPLMRHRFYCGWSPCESTPIGVHGSAKAPMCAVCPKSLRAFSPNPASELSAPQSRTCCARQEETQTGSQNSLGQFTGAQRSDTSVHTLNQGFTQNAPTCAWPHPLPCHVGPAAGPPQSPPLSAELHVGTGDSRGRGRRERWRMHVRSPCSSLAG